MSKKIVYALLALFAVTILPVKIFLSFYNIEALKSPAFALTFITVIFLIMFFASRSKSDLAHFVTSPILALSSLLCFFSCLWTCTSYFKGPAPDDLKVQYFFMSFISALSAFFFLFVAISHFSGKNMFKKFQILIFAPSLKYLLSLTLFFSFDVGTPDVFNVASQSFLLMFFVYYTQNYVECVKKTPKRSAVFGIPAILVTLSYTMHSIFSSHFNSLQFVTSVMYLVTSIYIALFLLDSFFEVRFTTKQNI